MGWSLCPIFVGGSVFHCSQKGWDFILWFWVTIEGESREKIWGEQSLGTQCCRAYLLLLLPALWGRCRWSFQQSPGCVWGAGDAPVLWELPDGTVGNPRDSARIYQPLIQIGASHAWAKPTIILHPFNLPSLKLEKLKEVEKAHSGRVSLILGEAKVLSGERWK